MVSSHCLVTRGSNKPDIDGRREMRIAQDRASDLQRQYDDMEKEVETMKKY